MLLLSWRLFRHCFKALPGSAGVTLLILIPTYPTLPASEGLATPVPASSSNKLNTSMPLRSEWTHWSLHSHFQQCLSLTCPENVLVLKSPAQISTYHNLKLGRIVCPLHICIFSMIYIFLLQYLSYFTSVMA